MVCVQPAWAGDSPHRMGMVTVTSALGMVQLSALFVFLGSLAPCFLVIPPYLQVETGVCDRLA